MQAALLEGTVHQLPSDLKDALLVQELLQEKWQTLTPLGRNEFICWVENAKLIETRARRIRRTIEELSEGQRRPCCWPGCIHREKGKK